MLLADDSHRGFSVPAGELMVQPDGRTSIADPPSLRWLLRVCGIQRWEPLILYVDMIYYRK